LYTTAHFPAGISRVCIQTAMRCVLTGGVARLGLTIDPRVVGRAPAVPRALSLGPFTLADARRYGLDRWNLRGASWRRLGPRTYSLARLDKTPQLKLEAASRRLPRGAAFSGFTAAWLHGLDVEPCDPIEVTVPSPARISTRAGILVHRRAMDRDEVVRTRGLPATSMVRTIRDLCMRLSLTEAVAIADMALQAGPGWCGGRAHRRRAIVAPGSRARGTCGRVADGDSIAHGAGARGPAAA